MKKLALLISGLTFCLHSSFAQKLVFSVIDVFPGTNKSSNPQWITSSGSLLFFQGTLQSHGTEPWRSDGTALNTDMAKNISTGSFSSNPKDFIAYNGNMIFIADNGSTGFEPWISDGSDAGTRLIKDICFGGVPSQPEQLCPCMGKMFFVAGTFAEGPELWATDGSDAGTYLVKDIRPGSNTSSISHLHCMGNKVIFGADNGTGQKTWVSDGSDTGTKMISGKNPALFFNYNGKAYLASGLGIPSMYPIDTATNVVGASGVFGMVETNAFTITYKGKLFFNGAVAGPPGPELYQTDGTFSGTQLVKDITPGAAGTILTNPMVVDDKLFFVAETFNEGKELWVTDGTDAGTVMIKDMIPGPTGSNPTHLYAYKHNLYFAADTAPGDRRLFISNGTTAGTYSIGPANALSNALGAGGFSGIAEYNGSLWFAAFYDSTRCAELWSVKDTMTYTGIPNVNTNLDFKLYPNPNNGTFTLQLDNANFRNGTVTVYDVVGKEVYKSPITDSKSQINLNTAKGIYFVKLQLDDAVLTKRITIE
jgi:ELWxxDGT repeat protein